MRTMASSSILKTSLQREVPVVLVENTHGTTTMGIGSVMLVVVGGSVLVAVFAGSSSSSSSWSTKLNYYSGREMRATMMMTGVDHEPKGDWDDGYW